MRIMTSNNSNLEDFDSWTVSIGNGAINTIQETDMIEIPEQMFIKIDDSSQVQCMKTLADQVYPNLRHNYRKKGCMDGQAILAPTNKQVDVINNLIADSFPGKPIVLTSSGDVTNTDDLQRFNTEY